MFLKSLKFLVKIWLGLASFSFSAQALAGIYADFSYGAVAEWANNAQGNINAKSFSQLGVTNVRISQDGDKWGGTQGNDFDVIITITAPNAPEGTTTSVSGTLNWVKNAPQNSIYYFGVIFADGVGPTADGYSVSGTQSGGNTYDKKTYIIPIPSKFSEADLNGALPKDLLGGSANFSDSNFNDLNQEFPAPAVTVSSVGNATEVEGSNLAHTVTLDWVAQRRR